MITNMGAANPRAAAERTLDIARELGLKGLKVACIEGDDVSAAGAARRSRSWTSRARSPMSTCRWSA